MPRVSREHLDARRRQIVNAARRCFVRDGFHATSMRDVLDESGLSAGAVYRYFAGKDEIIVAVVTDAVRELTSAFREAFDPEAPGALHETLAGMFTDLERLCVERDLSRLAVLVWGEAVRSSALAGPIAEALGEAREVFTRLVEIYRDRGLLPPDVSTDAAGRVLAGLVPGFMVQHAVFGDVDAVTFADGVRTLLGAAGARR